MKHYLQVRARFFSAQESFSLFFCFVSARILLAPLLWAAIWI
jgi:hypothetical protein